MSIIVLLCEDGKKMNHDFLSREGRMILQNRNDDKGSSDSGYFSPFLYFFTFLYYSDVDDIFLCSSSAFI